MSDVAIRVEGLSKKYQIGSKKERYKTLRDTLTDSFAAPIRRVGNLLRGRVISTSNSDETFWALKDVSFAVKRGEVVGIIGRNGAGKSTLLKILSRITEPTEGYADVYGRVGSLLEVGTGFHPELTGRENIYLNAAILGMKRWEIERKFDEIVAFAEVEKFIDTPVKRYSSGMYLRLAFAVAAHLEPQILLVDEVLAVGDTQFQDKCLAKMNDIARQDRAVIFVSHNMGAISRLCSRVLVLDKGHRVAEGVPSEVISQYYNRTRQEQGFRLSARTDRWGHGPLRINRIELRDAWDHPIEIIQSGQELRVVFFYQVEGKVITGRAVVKFAVADDQGKELFVCSSGFDPQGPQEFSGQGHLICVIPRFPLSEGKYFINYNCSTKFFEVMDALDGALELNVERGDFFGSGISYKQPTFYVDHQWLNCPELTESRSCH